MNTATFDSLAYFEKLKAAGVPEEQARIQAEYLRNEADRIEARMSAKADEINAAFQQSIQDHYAGHKGELATKEDVAEIQTSLTAVRIGIAEARSYLRLELEVSRKDVEMQIASMKYSLLKWQIGIAIAILGIMAKRFGWLGF